MLRLGEFDCRSRMSQSPRRSLRQHAATTRNASSPALAHHPLPGRSVALHDSATIARARQRTVCNAAIAHLADVEMAAVHGKPSRRSRGDSHDRGCCAGRRRFGDDRVARHQQGEERPRHDPRRASRSRSRSSITRRTPPRAASPPARRRTSACSTPIRAPPISASSWSARSTAARKRRRHLVIEACEVEDADEQAEATRRFATSDVEGVILPPPLSESQPILTELALAEMPVVTVAMGSATQKAAQCPHRRFRRRARR